MPTTVFPEEDGWGGLSVPIAIVWWNGRKSAIPLETRNMSCTIISMGRAKSRILPTRIRRCFRSFRPFWDGIRHRCQGVFHHLDNPFVTLFMLCRVVFRADPKLLLEISGKMRCGTKAQKISNLVNLILAIQQQLAGFI